MKQIMRTKLVPILLSVMMVFTLIPFIGLQEAKAASTEDTVEIVLIPNTEEYKSFNGESASTVYGLMMSLADSGKIKATLTGSYDGVAGFKEYTIDLDKDAGGSADLEMTAYYQNGALNRVVIRIKDSCSINTSTFSVALDEETTVKFVFAYVPLEAKTIDINLTNGAKTYTGDEAAALYQCMVDLDNVYGFYTDDTEESNKEIVQFDLDRDLNYDIECTFTKDSVSPDVCTAVKVERLEGYSLDPVEEFEISEEQAESWAAMTTDNQYGVSYYYTSITFLYKAFPLGPPMMIIDNADVQLSAKVFTYNGKTQRPKIMSVGVGLTEGQDYTVEWPAVSKDAGTYTVKITGIGNCVGTTEATYSIDPAKVAVPKGKTLVYAGSTMKGVAEGAAYTVSGNKAKNAGSYTAKLTLKDKKNYTWSDGTTAAKTVKWKIDKAANTLKAKGKKATVKYSKLYNKAQALKASKVINFKSKGQGSLNYKLAAAKKGNKDYTKSFKVAKKGGKVTVKKGLGKGTYKVTVKVKAKGNANYKASKTKKVTFTVVIK